MPTTLRAQTLLAPTCDGEMMPSRFGLPTKPRTLALEMP